MKKIITETNSNKDQNTNKKNNGNGKSSDSENVEEITKTCNNCEKFRKGVCYGDK